MGFGQYDSHHKPTMAEGTARARPNPKFNQPFRQITFDQIAAFIHAPAVAAKGSGTWMLASAYSGPDARVFGTQAEKGEYWALLVDIDRGLTQLDRLCEVLDGLLAGSRKVVHSSSSANAVTPKWHVIVPLAQPLPYVAFEKFQLALFDGLKANGILCDRTLARAAQLFYLPSIITPDAFYQYRDLAGEPFDPHDKTHWMHRHAAELFRQDQEREQANSQEDGPYSVIGWWRKNGPETEDLLMHYGYISDGKEYASPMQQASGRRCSTMVREDGSWFSLSDSDEAAGIGVKHRDGVHGDAFEILKYYGFNNDFDAALDWVKEQRNQADLALPSIRAYVEGLSK
jgi:hypothetical protein